MKRGMRAILDHNIDILSATPDPTTMAGPEVFLWLPLRAPYTAIDSPTLTLLLLGLAWSFIRSSPTSAYFPANRMA